MSLRLLSRVGLDDLLVEDLLVPPLHPLVRGSLVATPITTHPREFEGGSTA
jgi:hypothetical protein